MMRVKLWGTRGSLASPGPDTQRYGGNTSCVEVAGPKGTRLALDAGTGLRRLGQALPSDLTRIDILLTHLHLDHIQGLGFFVPLYRPDVQAHIWGPASTTQSLRARLIRYLSPPLFPVHLRDLPNLALHEVPNGAFEIGEFQITSAPVCHPDPTVGYRLTTDSGTLTYLPDHEPALGVPDFPLRWDWTSGYSLAADTDLLLHDAQYSDAEYGAHIGWGHSSLRHALAFAELVRAGHLVLFHHDPAHSDAELEQMTQQVITSFQPAFPVTIAREGATFRLGTTPSPKSARVVQNTPVAR